MKRICTILLVGVFMSRIVLETSGVSPAPPMPPTPELPGAAPTSFSTIEVQNAIYDAFGFWVPAANGDIVYIARRGTQHNPPEVAGKIHKWISDDNGASWDQSDIADSGTHDDRNCAGGIASTDTIMLFYSRYNVGGGAWTDIRYLRSTDNGSGFTDLGTIDVGTDTAFSPYGPTVELPSGKLMQSFYGDNGAGTYRVFVQFSEDDGQTWGDGVDIVSGATQYTEISIAYVDGASDNTSRLVGICRNNGGQMAQFSSTDGGATWSNDGYLDFSHIVSGFNNDVSPWVYNDGGWLHLVYADRVHMQLKHAIAELGNVVGNSNAWFWPGILHESSATDEIDFGYPSINEFGGNLEIMFYDAVGAVDPDIYHSF